MLRLVFSASFNVYNVVASRINHFFLYREGQESLLLQTLDLLQLCTSVTITAWHHWHRDSTNSCFLQPIMCTVLWVLWVLARDILLLGLHVTWHLKCWKVEGFTMNLLCQSFASDLWDFFVGFAILTLSRKICRAIFQVFILRKLICHNIFSDADTRK